ncbi:hypothetical protein [Aestuariimicrobium sp. Y1814]|uniref:hypothetical protein n=1 Tax=Aestuariimicrobium sp. Y1814 TaxID=3418742 RepID=UPI003DA72FE0
MSAVQILDPVDDSPRGTPKTRRRLKAVPEKQPSRVSRFPFILGLVALVALGMGGLVVVNTQIQTQAKELAALERQATNLGHQQAALEAEVNKLNSAASLEQEAYKLGMRPNPNPAFIVLPEGKILGTPTVVTGDELPHQVYLTWEQVVKQQEDARLQVVKDKQAAAEAARLKAEEERKKKAEEEEAKKKQEEEQHQSSAPTTPAP